MSNRPSATSGRALHDCEHLSWPSEHATSRCSAQWAGCVVSIYNDFDCQLTAEHPPWPASCCTVLSLFGVIILLALGSAFDRDAHVCLCGH